MDLDKEYFAFITKAIVPSVAVRIYTFGSSINIYTTFTSVCGSQGYLTAVSTKSLQPLKIPLCYIRCSCNSLLKTNQFTVFPWRSSFSIRYSP